MALEMAKHFASMFYVTNPYKSMYEKPEDMPNPDFTTKTIPYFAVLIALEHAILLLKGKRGIRVNDGLTSVMHAFVMLLAEVFLKSILYNGYLYVYKHYRVYELPWDNLGTWIIAMFAVDFGYYWVHRASHEINLLWAAHQVHHSSEDYNLTSALRQSSTQGLGTWYIYLPLALFLPPTHLFAHKEFNLVYQFWIHTEVVGDLGPLEYVLNTPKHHRVHHGSNRYCLDKNYAGFLIIWDRLFGTFEEYKPERKLVYGLVDQPQFFNVSRAQTFYYGSVWKKAQSMDNWSDWISAFLKGPGWFPGTPRLGDTSGVPEVPDREKYDPKVPTWMSAYTIVHFLLVVVGMEFFGGLEAELSQLSLLGFCLLFLWDMTSMGLIHDQSPLCWISEFVRCGFILLANNFFSDLNMRVNMPLRILNLIHGGSILLACHQIVVNNLGGGTKEIKLKGQ